MCRGSSIGKKSKWLLDKSIKDNTSPINLKFSHNGINTSSKISGIIVVTSSLRTNVIGKDMTNKLRNGLKRIIGHRRILTGKIDYGEYSSSVISRWMIC